MKLHYVTNDRGEVKAVQIPRAMWRKIDRRINQTEEQDWQDVSKDEIAAIEAGLLDFEQGRVLSNQSLFEKSRELREKRA